MKTIINIDDDELKVLGQEETPELPEITSGDIGKILTVSRKGDVNIPEWKSIEQAILTDYNALKSEVDGLIVASTENTSGWTIDTATADVEVSDYILSHSFEDIPYNAVVVDASYTELPLSVYPYWHPVDKVFATDGTIQLQVEDYSASSTARMKLVYAYPRTIDMSEVEDIRVGAGGTTYTTAGDAVRGQYSDLKNALDASIGVDLQPNITIVENEYVKRNGDFSAYNYWHRSGYIDVGGFTAIKITTNETDASNNYNCFYTEDYTAIPRSYFTLTNGTFPIPKNARYFALSSLTTVTFDVTGVVEPLIEKAPITLVDRVDTIAGGKYQRIDLTFTANQFINGVTGAVATGDVSTLVSNPVDVSQYAKVKIWASSYYSNGICCFYDNNDSPIVNSLVTAESGSTPTNYEQWVDVPSTAKYVRLSYISPLVGGLMGNLVAQVGYSNTKQIYDWSNVKWVAFGDSLTDYRNTKATMSYYDYIAYETGIDVINAGVSGSGYASDGEIAYGADTNWHDRILTLENTDFDVITLFGSGNDLSVNLPWGTIDDSTADSICGCINLTIQNLYSIKPLAKVGIIAPTPWKTTVPWENSENTGMGKYCSLLKQIANKNGIPYLDLYHESNMRPSDADFREHFYSRDGNNGVHPDENGHERIHSQIREFLAKII